MDAVPNQMNSILIFGIIFLFFLTMNPNVLICGILVVILMHIIQLNEHIVLKPASAAKIAPDTSQAKNSTNSTKQYTYADTNNNGGNSESKNSDILSVSGSPGVIVLRQLINDGLPMEKSNVETGTETETDQDNQNNQDDQDDQTKPKTKSKTKTNHKKQKLKQTAVIINTQTGEKIPIEQALSETYRVPTKNNPYGNVLQSDFELEPNRKSAPPAANPVIISQINSLTGKSKINDPGVIALMYAGDRMFITNPCTDLVPGDRTRVNALCGSTAPYRDFLYGS